MDRRRFLLATGASGVSLALAGCSDGSDDSGDDGDGTADDEQEEENPDDQETEEQETEDQEPDEQQADELIDSADQNLDEAATLFEQQLSAVDPDSPEAIDSGPVRELLDQAEQDLEAARPIASEDQQEAVDVLDALLAFMRDFVEMFVAFGDALEEFALVEGLIDNRRVDEAVGALERAESNIDEARSLFETAQSSIQDIDTDRLDTLTRLDFEQLSADLAEVEGYLIAFEVLTSGLREFTQGLAALQSGTAALEEGGTLLDQESFAGAATAFEESGDEYATATSRFQAAVDVFTDVDEGVPADARGDIEEFRCQFDAFAGAAERFETGTRLFADGATLLDEGNQSEAEQRFNDGEQAITEAEQLITEAENC